MARYWIKGRRKVGRGIFGGWGIDDDGMSVRGGLESERGR